MSSGLWTRLLSDDGLIGRGTASVEVEEAGLVTGEDDIGELKIDLLAPTACAGDETMRGTGILNCRLPPCEGILESSCVSLI
jgi:hypothetical protein